MRFDDTSRDGASRLKDLLAKDTYQTQSINLIQKAEAPSDCTAIVIAGPTGNYEQPEVDASKPTSKTAAALSSCSIRPSAWAPTASQTTTRSLPCSPAGASPSTKTSSLDLNPIGQLYGFGGQVALVNSLRHPSPSSADMKSTFTGFPLARSLTYKNADKTTIEKLFDTFPPTSFATTNLSSPKINVKDPSNKQGPLTLAVAGSYNTGSPAPRGRFVCDRQFRLGLECLSQLQRQQGSRRQHCQLALLRRRPHLHPPKAPEDRRITMTTGQLAMVRIVSQFVLPLIVIVGGIMVW